jgi:ribosomal RNA assembly protein
LQLESGEYFLKPREKQQRDEAKRIAKVRTAPALARQSLILTPFLPFSMQQTQVTATRQEERAKAFVAPEEGAARAAVGAVGDAKEKKKKRKRDEAGDA